MTIYGVYMKGFDRSIVREICLDRGIPITEFLLDTFYRKMRYPITLLGVSPISKHIVNATLLAAKDLNSPIMFIASLNQVDFDIGYTGWTPKSFTEFVGKEAERLDVNVPIIIGLDHCGPWLKDLHLQEKYDLNDAMESARKSLESALLAGYDVIHIDSTIDPYVENLPPETVADRTLNLLEYAETFRIDNDIPPVNYEIGSDRWIYRDEKYTEKLISIIMKKLRRNKVVRNARILFMVGDVGTKVIPGNRLDIDKARKLVDMASRYNLYLKTHSTDYIVDPEDFPRIGIGGANIGPMFADIEYKVLKKLSLIEKEFIKKNIVEKPSRILETLIDSIIADGRWRKYSKKELKKISEEDRELIFGLCSRYVLSKIDENISQLIQNLLNNGIDGERMLLNELKNVVENLLKNFNLYNLNEKIIEFYRVKG